jgi:hypothetical protein
MRALHQGFARTGFEAAVDLHRVRVPSG